MFKVGDKVVCINSEHLEYLEKNQIYTVKEFRETYFIYVIDMKGNVLKGSYYTWRFITLKESRKNKIIEIKNGK